MKVYEIDPSKKYLIVCDLPMNRLQEIHKEIKERLDSDQCFAIIQDDVHVVGPIHENAGPSGDCMERLDKLLEETECTKVVLDCLEEVGKRMQGDESPDISEIQHIRDMSRRFIAALMKWRETADPKYWKIDLGALTISNSLVTDICEAVDSMHEMLISMLDKGTKGCNCSTSQDS